ncbi:MAG: hypothetical protein AB8D78_10020 [Akkermansiaceae bacterium]
MNKNIVVPALALVIGAGVGFGLGKSKSDAQTAIEKMEADMRTKSGARSSMGEAERSGGRGKVARNLDEIYLKPGQSNRIQALLDMYSNLGPDEFAPEAEKLEALPFNERILASVLLFGKWAEVDPTAAMAYTDSMGFTGAFVRPTVLQGWASTDPVNASKYYTENTGQFAMMNMMSGRRGGMSAQGPAEIIASEWAKQDSGGAMKWASELKMNSSRAMTSVVSQVAKTNPEEAAGMISDMPEDAQGGAFETVAKEWGVKNFTEASAWANGLPEEHRAEAMSSAIKGLAQSSPELAAAEIGKMTDEEAKADAIPEVAKNYARLDVKGSMDWLNSLDSEEAKKDSMRQVMPIWAASDSEGALEFVKNQPSAEVKDRAAETYIWSNRTSSPSELAGVAEMITDKGDRSRATGVVAARWMQEDKEGATEYINGSETLSDDAKERLLSGRPYWGGRRGR